MNSRPATDLLLQCSTDGDIVWMNPAARSRLGVAENLFRCVPAASQTRARQFLNPHAPRSDQSWTCDFFRADRQVTLPIRFVRLLNLANGAILMAEPSERASDTPLGGERMSETLADLLCGAFKHYSRVLVVQDRLQAIVRNSPSASRCLVEELECERARLARALHATAGQTLAGIRISLELIKARFPALPPNLEEVLTRIEGLTADAMSQLRDVSHKLHPPDWERLSLPQLLDWLWRSTGIPDRFQAKLEVDQAASGLSLPLRITIYRLAQEALSNVVRHSGAAAVALSLRVGPNSVTMAVEDNGAGFDPNQPLGSHDADGIGLRSMKEQACLLGGEMKVQSGPSGTRLTFSFPRTKDEGS